MRIWFSGPRILGGLVRPGISFGPEDFRRRRAQSRAASADVVGLARSLVVFLALFAIFGGLVVIAVSAGP